MILIYWFYLSSYSIKKTNKQDNIQTKTKSLLFIKFSILFFIHFKIMIVFLGICFITYSQFMLMEAVYFTLLFVTPCWNISALKHWFRFCKLVIYQIFLFLDSKWFSFSFGHLSL